MRRLLLFTVFILLGFSFDLQAQTTARFTLEYPTAARPAKILRAFVAPGGSQPAREGIDIYAPSGARIRAGAAGRVRKVVLAENGLGYGAYVTIQTNVNGVRYRVTYAGLTRINVTEGQMVSLGALIGRSAGNSIKIVVQASQGGMSGFQLPNIINPRSVLRLNNMRLRPMDNGVRLRAAPTLDAQILSYASQWHLLETPDNAYKAMWKAGKNGAWLRVRLSDGRIAYAAAQFLKVVSTNDPAEGLPGIPVAGMNLDIDFAHGRPNAASLVNLGWVRLNYDMSYNPSNGTYGNTDYFATYNRYAPSIQHYASAGNKVIIILTHEFYGEGQGYDWHNMSSSSWRALSDQFAAYAGIVAGQYAGQNVVYAYQIWNEQDSNPGSPAAVAMPPNDYAYLLTKTILAIRAVDPTVKIITGGHVSGPTYGPVYARSTLSAMPAGVRPDGIAIHPYGRGPAGSPFSIFGALDTEIKQWCGVMPDTPLWITEWGVLDKQNEDTLSGQVADYSDGFLNIIHHKYPGMVAAAVWFAWADGMHNGFGLVDEFNLPKQPLYDRYLLYNYQNQREIQLLPYGADGWLPLPPIPSD